MGKRELAKIVQDMVDSTATFDAALQSQYRDLFQAFAEHVVSLATRLVGSSVLMAHEPVDLLLKREVDSLEDEVDRLGAKLLEHRKDTPGKLESMLQQAANDVRLHTKATSAVWSTEGQATVDRVIGQQQAVEQFQMTDEESSQMTKLAKEISTLAAELSKEIPSLLDRAEENLTALKSFSMPSQETTTTTSKEAGKKRPTGELAKHLEKKSKH